MEEIGFERRHARKKRFMSAFERKTGETGAKSNISTLSIPSILSNVSHFHNVLA
jgi:hypothetical protein